MWAGSDRGRFDLAVLGGCFFMAWMNGTFFTSALSMAGPSLPVSFFWNLSLAGVFAGLAVHVVLEGRVGQFCLRPVFVVVSALAVSLSTLAILLFSPNGGSVAKAACGVASFVTGAASATFYISWTQLYASLPAGDAEVCIPLTVALAQLVALLLGWVGGWFSCAALVLCPCLSAACILHLLPVWYGRRTSARPVSSASGSAAMSCGLLDPRYLAFVASVWFALSSITSLVQAGETGGFVDSYAAPFVVSFAVLLALMMLYVFFARRITPLESARVVTPVIVLSIAALAAFGPGAAPTAFLVARTAAMFYWALLQISVAEVVREGALSATRAAGLTRGAIQGGAALSVPVSFLLERVDLGCVAFCLTGLVCVTFSIALPALLGTQLRATGEEEGTGEFPDPNGDGERMVEDEFLSRCGWLASNYGLSPREQEVAACLLRGRDMPYIRESLCISRNTINTHVRHIYSKTGVHSKQELISLFEQLRR